MKGREIFCESDVWSGPPNRKSCGLDEDVEYEYVGMNMC